ADLGPAMDAALATFARGGGGLLLLAGPEPGAARFARGRLGGELTFATGAPTLSAPLPLTRPDGVSVPSGSQASPEPQSGGPTQAGAAEVLMWDDDPVRGARAWREAAPLSDVAPLARGGGDRVLLAAREGGAPLWLSRAVGRGQALL